MQIFGQTSAGGVGTATDGFDSFPVDCLHPLDRAFLRRFANAQQAVTAIYGDEGAGISAADVEDVCDGVSSECGGLVWRRGSESPSLLSDHDNDVDENNEI